jgi:cytosine/adenosine deaminase-related metal-dependent hydrolase
VVVCPRSNMGSGFGVAMASGARVGLGTDGIDGDILAEARAYWYRHAEGKDALARESAARIAAGQELAARAFGDTGAARIGTGAKAHLTVLDYDPLTPMTPSNLVDHVVRGWTSQHVRDTMVSGRFVVRDRKLLQVDERELAVRARAAASRLWERMQGYH